MDIAIHINPTQRHQIEHAQWFMDGFKMLSIDHNVIVTRDIGLKADIHIISGPHYAKQALVNHPMVLMIDRAYYHNERGGSYSIMHHVSIGWLKNDGSREFRIGDSGKHQPITIKSKDCGSGAIFLADYNGPIRKADTIRLHPEQYNHRESLIDVLRRHDTAIGYKTSALVTAALEGLKIECLDPSHIINRPNWLELLPWADWHYSEIQSGELWEHLQQP